MERWLGRKCSVFCWWCINVSCVSSQSILLLWSAVRFKQAAEYFLSPWMVLISNVGRIDLDRRERKWYLCLQCAEESRGWWGMNGWVSFHPFRRRPGGDRSHPGSVCSWCMARVFDIMCMCILGTDVILCPALNVLDGLHRWCHAASDLHNVTLLLL